MNYKAIIYPLLAVSASLTACTDMLEKEPLDSNVNSPVFWNTVGNIQNYANSFYTDYPSYNSDFYVHALSDDQVSTGFTDWKYLNVPAGDGNWSSPWTEIRRANAMIESINAYSTGLDAATKNYWLGVARLNRAYQYWNLVRKYGDCPYTDKVLDIDSPELYSARVDRDVVMDKVLEDLNFACENITSSSSKQEWSQEMANALKSKICLWEGTFRKYRSTTDGQKAPDEEGAARFLNACVEADQAIMASGNNYQLGDYKSLYNSTSLLDNSEVIFCKEYKQSTLTHSLIANTSSSSEQSGMSKDAFDSYLFTDGKPKALTTLNTDDAGVLKPSSTDGGQHLNITAQLKVRDKRLAATIDSVVCYAGREWKRTADGMSMSSASGYTVWKYDNLSIPLEFRKAGNYTWSPTFWLAVIYLDYAEAKAELADLGKGQISQADLDATVNKLRERAGLPGMALQPEHDPANNMGVSDLIWEIRRERRCELMFDEDFRYWDLIRWHQLALLDSSKHPNILIGANLKNEPTPDLTRIDLTADKYMDGTDGHTRVFDAKNYLYPIPTEEITLNKNLGQNPGW